MKIIRHLDADQKPAFAAQTPDGSFVRISGDLFGEFQVTDEPVVPGALLSPVMPRLIQCIGLNYRKHAEETGAKLPTHPVLFTKSPSAIQHPHQPIRLPRKLVSHEVDYEGELAVVIGQDCLNANRENAYDFVLGYTCANDVSARDWQKMHSGGQWCRGKTFDTFCPLGPVLVTKDEIPDPHSLRISTILNGEIMQDSHTGDLIFDIPTLIEFLSADTTLPAGTVILTGTPSGVGMARKPPVWLQAGDIVTVSIERIGELTTPVE